MVVDMRQPTSGCLKLRSCSVTLAEANGGRYETYLMMLEAIELLGRFS